MASYRFPILLWQDLQGGFTACLAQDVTDQTAAVGDTASQAVDRLRDYLRWLYRKNPHLPAPDFLDPVMSYARVEVRPEYKVEKKTFPSQETFTQIGRAHV